MRKVAIGGLLFMLAAGARADGDILAGMELSVQLTQLDAHTVHAKVVAPKDVKTPWDKLAAGFTGCTVTGERVSHAPAPDEGRFDKLDCPGHPTVKISGFAVSDASQTFALEAKQPGDSFSVVLMDGASYQ
jgi:hypothetical protein